MADITNDVNSLIDEMFAAMQGAPRPDFQALFSKSLGALDAAPDAAQRPVPDAVSPLVTAASTFFGNLASNMSGNPNFAGAVNNSLARYEQERQQIEEENFARKSAYDERKNNQRLSLLMKINELEAEDALKRNDLGIDEVIALVRNHRNCGAEGCPRATGRYRGCGSGP